MNAKGNKKIAMAYDGAAYILPIGMDLMFLALDPFQNASNAWRRALTATARRG